MLVLPSLPMQAVDHPYLVVYSKTGRKAPDYAALDAPGAVDGAPGGAAPAAEILGGGQSAAGAAAALAAAAVDGEEEALICGICGDAADDPVVSP